MTWDEAQNVASELEGWDDVEIHQGTYGDVWIEATEPTTGRRMTYSPATGYFE